MLNCLLLSIIRKLGLLIIFNQLQKKKAPIPKKDKNPITSVIVVTKTLDAIAGSILNLFKLIGTSIPNKPATIIFSIIEMEIIRAKVISWNHI